MREISLRDVKEKIKKTVQEANFILREDLLRILEEKSKEEESEGGREVFNQILKNARIAKEEFLALCQDTGVALFFVEIGEEIRFGYEGFKGIRDAIEQGMIEGYKEGYLRKSIVEDPIRRKNTGNNAPAFIHWELVPGDRLKIYFLAKGGGAENMSALRMFAPAAGAEGVENFVVETVEKAGSNPCPPIIVGVGIGGNFEMAPLLAKRALLRNPVGSHHPDPFYAEMEERLLKRINNLGIGPQGLGGRITALAVHIEVYPCHIASMPVAVNIECHSHRIREIEF